MDPNHPPDLPADPGGPADDADRLAVEDDDRCDACWRLAHQDYRAWHGRLVYLCWGCMAEAAELARRVGKW